jgi:hypothetical protein
MNVVLLAMAGSVVLASDRNCIELNLHMRDFLTATRPSGTGH